jgi:excisionase family DNA binding protein
MIEVGGIERINRAVGYGAGEEVWHALVGQLRGALHQDAVVAEFGDRRLVVLLEEIRSECEAVRIAMELLGVIRSPRFSGVLRLRLSASVGVLMIEGDAETPATLLRDVGAAAQVASRRGTNRVEVFRPEARQLMVRTLRLEAELCKAIESSQLELHLQPIVSLSDGVPIAIEALVRWRHPDRGLIGPDQFFAIAEQSGLITDIDDWMLAEVCSSLAAWTRQDPSFPCPPVSINVSARQLAEGTLEARLSAALMATGVRPSQLVLEITESSAMELLPAPLESLGALKRLGVELWLDDFGTGYSSLARLAQLPIDAVKIDRGFLAGVTGMTGPAPIVAAIVEMGHTLGLLTIAEGIETSDQLATVEAAGVDAAQGFLIGRPFRAAGVEDLRRALEQASAATGAGPATDQDADEEIGLNEAAAILSVSPSTMRRLADRGALPVRKTAGGHRRFRRVDLRRLARLQIGESQLRARRLPTTPLPHAVAVLRESGEALATRAAEEMYEGARTGWFRTPQGRTRAGLWLDAFTESLARQRYRDGIEASACFLERARQGGASIAECIRFLSGFGQLVGREILRAGDGDREDVRGLQAIVSVATESFLERIEK